MDLNKYMTSERTEMKRQLSDFRFAAKELLATIELHTDCMTNDIDRSALDDYIEALEQALEQSS